MNPLYKGIKLIHELDTIPMIKKVIRKFNPELMMEIGTAHGGLTLVFHEACPKAELHTYDPFRNIKQDKMSLFGKNVFFYSQDAFKSNLYELCECYMRKFLFCDGFDKKKEMLTFAPLLNIGDMVGVHDYPSRLWRDWKRGKNAKNMEPIISPDIIELLKDFTPLEENKEFEVLQKKSGKINSYSDRYWIKEK